MKKTLILLTLLTMASCSSNSPQTWDTNLSINQNLPTQEIQINSKTYTVELATTPSQQRIGLQNRQKISESQGMLFIFPDSQIRNFWMKDTLIPLDIIFLDQNLQVTQIYANTPSCQSQDPSQINCPHYPSSSPAQYVLELKAGQAQKDGIKINDTLRLQY